MFYQQLRLGELCLRRWKEGKDSNEGLKPLKT